MTLEERSRALRAEADAVVQRIDLRRHCARIGELIPTGSYYLDLMMYPDIDLYLPLTTAEELLAVGTALARYECVRRLNFIRGGDGDLRDGLYLKPVVEHGNWERPWKIDIWSLPKDVIDRKQAELAGLKRRMTSAHRQRILECKRQLLTAAGRTPMFSGIYIYQAVIDHGLTKTDEIVQFLKNHGIVL